MARITINLGDQLEQEISDIISSIKNEIMEVHKEQNGIKNNRLKKDLEKECRSAVDTFYKGYTPHSGYQRQRDLYNAYKIVDDGENVYVEYGDEFMQYAHHQSNKFIFENSFMKPYHGGSWGAEGEGRGGEYAAEPWYRAPNPYFTHWYSPAVKSNQSIYDIMSKTLPGIFKKAEDKYDRAMMKWFNPYKRKIEEIVKKLKM